ncbi:globin domain-containing protein [Paractinoplanes atraurantiacus]|uniref:Hemoglobin n=1 Tax=Paractinoplanes atraurantiacus TaxID=1036182 RepID=A0A285IL23_9ACTN|nr:oxidoreductase [Actinoplanes atraurantiacus]SNY48593.1 hemoglobin [Actinoplanes atraurantiacus]
MSLFEAAGGAPAMLALAGDFHERCLADPVLEHPFSNRLNPDHVRHLAEYWGEVFGGPPVFSTEHGGHIAMLRLHANQGAYGDIGDRFIACFDAAAEATIADPAARRAMSAYIRHATAEVMSYSPRDAVVPPTAPMPRWDLAP